MVEDKSTSKESWHDYMFQRAKEWANKEINTIPSMVAFSIYDDAEMVSLVKTRYENDKKEYLESGQWPKGAFFRRDDMWSYYFFLQLTDTTINLEKYLDFDYDSSKFDRDSLISIVFRHGFKVLFLFCLYISSGSDMNFDDFVSKKEQENREYNERMKRLGDSFERVLSSKKNYYK